MPNVLADKHKDNSIAIIPARGGSKRIPGKNIKLFCGQPIIKYSIDAALSSGMFSEVMVSTDDADIADMAKQYGARVPFMRSDAASSDYATTPEVMREVLACYRQKDAAFEYLCCIYPTAPFLTGEKLREAFKCLQSGQADAVVPVVRYSFPPQRCFAIRDSKVTYQWPEYALTRSQDLEPVYHDCGQFYFIKTETFMETGSLIAANTLPLVMPEAEVQDIDNVEDWEIAEMKFQMMSSKGVNHETV